LFLIVIWLCCSWNTQDIQSQGRLSIDSTGHKDLGISARLGGSHFESKGGVIGGSVDLQGISTHCELHTLLLVLSRFLNIFLSLLLSFAAYYYL